MPGFLTYYANNRFLDAAFGGQSVATPATWYVGLSLVPAGRAGSVAEPSGGGYARVAVANTQPANFPAAVNGTKSNANAITFPTPTGAWGTVVALFFADAASGGNVWLVSDLASPRTVVTGTAPVIAAGSAVLQDA